MVCAAFGAASRDGDGEVTEGRVGGSFRDPSGFVFERDGRILRQVNESYRDEYEAFMASGLFDELVAEGLLLAHVEVALEEAFSSEAVRVLAPTPLRFVSYPYEWCFGQLRDAALLTLDIQRRALARGLTLKDASAFNVQFVEGRPVLIDTLSFERRREGAPWIAYGQFCQHFLAPLLLMSRVDVRLGRLLERYLDGIPLDLASRLLPRTTWARFGSLLHVHLHAMSQRRFANEQLEGSRLVRPIGEKGLQGLVSSLETAVRRLKWEPKGTEWADYSTTHAYSAEDQAAKVAVVRGRLQKLRPKVVWDLGANTGEYSRLAADAGATVVAIDGDPAAVEKAYRAMRPGGGRVLPLWIDLTNPSPSTGWALRERLSLVERGPADVVMALALVHHLAISNNVPLEHVARFMSELAPSLLIEFVPKEDPQAQRLLVSRADIFPDYTQDGFEQAFARFFDLRHVVAVGGSGRRIYDYMRR
jgi:hypothetical protein